MKYCDIDAMGLTENVKNGRIYYKWTLDAK